MLLTCKQWYDGIMQAMVNIDAFWVQRDFPGSAATYLETLHKCGEALCAQVTQTPFLERAEWGMEFVRERHLVFHCLSNGYSNICFPLPVDMKPSPSFGGKIMQVVFLRPSSEWLIHRAEVRIDAKVEFTHKIALAANSEFVTSRTRLDTEQWFHPIQRDDENK